MWTFRNLKSMITDRVFDDHEVMADIQEVIREAHVIKVYGEDGILMFVYSRSAE